ncbi:MAG: LPS export ABC transporter periplasmic protein LptC [Bacteroidales bacterium]|nr:LPS export ABC transporter periplasmic protein LptC [Bacteroidales bacterium]
MILLVGIVFFVSCENNIDKIKLITDIDKRPSATAENIVVNYTKNGRLEMKLFAPLLEQYSWNKDAPYNEFKKGIKVLFYSEEGELQSTLNADYAKYYMNKKLWEVRDNVEMINPDGDKLTTNLMYADENSQKMYSDEYVKITTQDGTEISGKRGFISNFDFTEYSFKNVSGIINVKENK